MRTRQASIFLSAALAACLLAGCGGAASPAAPAAASSAPAASSVPEAPAASPEAEAPAEAALADGVYTAAFETDSSMFAVNEACGGRGTLTVQGGQMTLHVSLKSKKIVNLFVGTAEAAQQAGAAVLEPTVDTVTYPDGLSDEVYGFDIPVAELGEEFDLAILGTKGKWYDHRVSVQDPQPEAAEPVSAAALGLADGNYLCEVTLGGGSGRATVESPAALTVADGAVTLTVVWSSPNFDYMKVGEETYLPTNTEGNSTFALPLAGFDAALPVVADTVAMSTPHEVEYTLLLDSATLQPVE